MRLDDFNVSSIKTAIYSHGLLIPSLLIFMAYIDQKKTTTRQ